MYNLNNRSKTAMEKSEENIIIFMAIKRCAT